MSEFYLPNCNNCGAPYEGDKCLYCGRGFGVIIQRIKQAANYVIAPNKKPKVKKIIEVCASNAKEMREIAKQNARAHQEATCVAKIINKIDKKVRKAVEKGETSCEIGQIYIRCDKYEQSAIDKHYNNLGFRFNYDITWTNKLVPDWDMAEFDTVVLSW